MRTERQRRGIKISRILGAVAVAAGVFLLQTTNTRPAAPRGGESLLQFASSGHVVGFGMGAVYIASAAHMMKLEFKGARRVAPVGEVRAAADSGDGPGTLDRVTYPSVWDGVTVVYEKRPGTVVESSYRIEAGIRGNPVETIRLTYNRPVRVNATGDLVIEYENGEMRESAPAAWQEDGGVRKDVAVRYRVIGEREVGFHVGDFDPDLPLVIDPALTWHTFLGGSGWDVGRGIAVDAAGYVYLTGYSDAGWGSPLRRHTLSFDAFAAKLDQNGNLVWNTFLGGTGADYAYGIAVDGSGNASITGDSDASWGSPLNAYAGRRDVFVARLDRNGTLTWNTFLGSGDTDYAYATAADDSGNAYVTGYSVLPWGSPLRDYTDGNDAFAAKLGRNGNLVWNTFLGGSGSDKGRAIALDREGNVYVAGYSDATWGSPVRIYSEGYEAFAAKLDASGGLVWNSFLGGTGADFGCGIAVDRDKNVFVTGYSNELWSSPVDFYTSGNDGFVTKLDSSGAIVWNTFLGGDGNDFGEGIVLDGDGNVFIAGSSNATWGTPVNSYSSRDDGFVVKFDSSGKVAWSTFLGGSGDDFGEAIALDGSGSLMIAGTSDGAWDSTVGGFSAKYDAFAAKIPGTPTLTKYSSFKATSRTGYIALNWVTATEKGMAGFHVWRKDATSADYRRLTTSLVPAAGNTTAETSYEFTDGDIIAGESYLYKLEDVDGKGASSFSGPVSAVAGTILLISPANISMTKSDTPPTFSWDGGAFTKFKLEFSPQADFTATPLTLPAGETWIGAGSYSPSRQEWESIKTLGEKIHWRIRGKTARGNETTSETRWLLIRPARKTNGVASTLSTF